MAKNNPLKPKVYPDRKPRAQGSKKEDKYERQTGRNPRQGHNRSPDPKKR